MSTFIGEKGQTGRFLFDICCMIHLNLRNVKLRKKNLAFEKLTVRDISVVLYPKMVKVLETRE